MQQRAYVARVRGGWAIVLYYECPVCRKPRSNKRYRSATFINKALAEREAAKVNGGIKL